MHFGHYDFSWSPLVWGFENTGKAAAFGFSTSYEITLRNFADQRFIRKLYEGNARVSRIRSMQADTFPQSFGIPSDALDCLKERKCLLRVGGEFRYDDGFGDPIDDKFCDTYVWLNGRAPAWIACDQTQASIDYWIQNPDKRQ